MNLLLTAAAILVAAWLVARAVGQVKLPPLLGMIVGGALAAHLLPEQLVSARYGALKLEQVAPLARDAVLALVLARAGLSLSVARLRSTGTLALRLGLVPLFGDAALLTAGGVLLLGLSLGAALVLGFTVAAISPAIVIPGVLKLLDKRQERDRRVPAALLAGAPLDNIACLAALGIVLDLAAGGDDSVAGTLLLLPVSLLAAVLLGLACGGLVTWLLGRISDQRKRALLVWAVACSLIVVGRWLGIAYVLSVIALGVAVRARMEGAAREVDQQLQRAWGGAQYVLFGLIGAALDLKPLAQAGLLVAAVIGLGQLGRASAALLATRRIGLSLRQRTACVMCYVPKATIQAVFGGAALDHGLADGNLILAAAVLAIAICAPIGVVTLDRVADRLLPGGGPVAPHR